MIFVCYLGPWLDPYSGWPCCLVFDLSAAVGGGACCRRSGGACPDRGLAVQGTVTVLTACTGPALAIRPRADQESDDRDHHAAIGHRGRRCHGRQRGGIGRRHPQGRARRSGDHDAGWAAGQPAIPHNRRRLRADARLGTHVRDRPAGRGGMHRLLRRGADPIPARPTTFRSSRSTSRTRPPDANAARATPSTPSPPREPCCPAGPQPSPRPATDRWR